MQLQPDVFPASDATSDPELTMAENLQERPYQRLREDLLTRRFQPGERLEIRNLANQWGANPMPVHATLQRLVAEGALKSEA